MENIHFIEATWSDTFDWGNVTKEYTLEDYETENWKFGRLKTVN